MGRRVALLTAAIVIAAIGITIYALIDCVRSEPERLRGEEEVIQLGGGLKAQDKQRAQGKMTARERVETLCDPGAPFLELGLWVAYGFYEEYGGAPAAGVVVGIGKVHGRDVVVVANDATVKAGAWWPETITKMLRAQEIAMRCRVPIVYLVDSSGVNLPYQGGVFPGQYGASRIFYYNSIMRRYLRVPQIAAVMGPCIAGGAYLPALSDVILMVEGTSFMGLGGPNLVKGATGQTVDAESLGGARVHTEISGVAHYRVPDDPACVERIRELVAEMPYAPPADVTNDWTAVPGREPSELYDLLPEDHRQPYDMTEVLNCLLDKGRWDWFQRDRAPEMITLIGRLKGMPVGVIANARGAEEPADPAFSPAEAEHLRSWIAGGGSLLLIADHEPFGSAAGSLSTRESSTCATRSRCASRSGRTGSWSRRCSSRDTPGRWPTGSSKRSAASGASTPP